MTYIRHLAVILSILIDYCRSSIQPNIIFIMADDYGWNDIGYHNSEIATPNMDALANSGVKLENYYVQPTCTPTRSQLMTGRYQIHTGMQHRSIYPAQPHGLPIRFPTIADKLKEVGYSTHMVGKWHLGHYRKDFTPTFRGFDTFYGILTGSGDHFTHERCNTVKIKGSREQFCGLDLWNNNEPVWNETNQYSTHLYTRKATDIINQHDQNKPLFMYFSLQAVHTPLQVPRQYIKKFDYIKDKERRFYAGMVGAMDEAVGNLTTALKQKGLYDNSIIVFSTDNGGQPFLGASNWPLRGGKGTHWEGGVRGIGFVHSPLIGLQGKISRDLIHVSDWFPTLVTLGGGTTRGIGRLDGFNVWRTISTNSVSPRKEILHNIDPLKARFGIPKFKDPFDTSIRAAIRVGDMKLITGDPGKSSWTPPPHMKHLREVYFYKPPRNKNFWLFNITEDPLEEFDMSHRYPDIVKKLLRKLNRYSQSSVPPIYPEADARSNPIFNDGVWGPWLLKKTPTTTAQPDAKNRKRPGTLHHKSFFKKINSYWHSLHDKAMAFVEPSIYKPNQY